MSPELVTDDVVVPLEEPVLAGEFLAGEVEVQQDGPGRREALLKPFEPRHGVAHAPPIHRDDEPRPLRNRQEFSGGHLSLLRVPPADQRLEPLDPSRGEIHDRLVGGPQLASPDSRPQVSLQAQGAQRRGVHLGLEQHVTPAPLAARGLQRDARVAQELLGSAVTRGADGDPDARRDGGLLLLLDREGRGDRDRRTDNLTILPS